MQYLIRITEGIHILLTFLRKEHGNRAKNWVLTSTIMYATNKEPIFSTPRVCYKNSPQLSVHLPFWSHITADGMIF